MAANGQRGKAAKKPRKNVPQKRSRLRPWMLLCAAVLCIGAYLYYSQAEEEKPVARVPKHEVETTGSGANIDFTAKTKQVHAVVDEILKEHAVAILDIVQEDKAVRRQSVEGEIKWNARTIPVSVAKSETDALRGALDAVLARIDAEVLDAQPDYYKGQAALRLDVGIQESLEGDHFRVIADKLYVIVREEKIDVAGAGDAPPPRRPDGKGKLALVIDDFGYTQEPIALYAKIDRPLTFAILPYHPYSDAAARTGAKNGQQIILHMPMEAMSSEAKEERYTIHTSMSDSEIVAMVHELTQAVPHIVGANNHQGSKATSDRRVMRTVLREFAARGLFFVDSKTIGSSVAYEMALQYGVRAAENRLFIDNQNDVEAIKKQLRQAARLALKNGEMIAIGHARVNTAKAIAAMIPELEAQGVELVFVSSLLR